MSIDESKFKVISEVFNSYSEEDFKNLMGLLKGLVGAMKFSEEFHNKNGGRFQELMNSFGERNSFDFAEVEDIFGCKDEILGIAIFDAWRRYSSKAEGVA